MSDVFRNSAFVNDDVLAVADHDAIPAEGPIVVSLTRWRGERTMLAARKGSVGVRIEVAEAIESDDDFAGAALVVLPFPKFSDGRSYSKARALRERLGFAGEIRAVGDVLQDQIPLMVRCGFTSFVVTNVPTRRALEEGRLPAIAETYQSVGANRAAAWRRSGVMAAE